MLCSELPSCVIPLSCPCSGGYIKRDGRPRDADVLVSRLVDRPIRPMFKSGWACETQVGRGRRRSGWACEVQVAGLGDGSRGHVNAVGLLMKVGQACLAIATSYAPCSSRARRETQVGGGRTDGGGYKFGGRRLG